MVADLTQRIEGGAYAPSTARSLVRRFHAQMGPEMMQTVALLVSELVTNAVRHASASYIWLRAEVLPAVVRVEVADPGQGFTATPLPADPNRTHGWGLFLVDELADRWGVSGEDRTRVWFELDRA